MAILIFQHSPHGGALRLGEKLRGYGPNLKVVRIDLGEPVPEDLSDVDGIITTGGPQRPDDDSQPWMAAEMALLKEAHEVELPVVGICLGSQILGRALGGTTGLLDDGKIELGWHELRLNHIGREDPLHGGFAWNSMQFHWHSYQLTELPPGAQVLASSDVCKVQAWSMGLRTYGFQYHPEVYRESIEQWAADEPQDLTDAGVTLEQLREDTEKHFAGFERLSDRLFERMALLLMAPDRRCAGVARDMHH